MMPLVREGIDGPLDVLEISSSVLVDLISEHADLGDKPPGWCRTVTMEEYGHGRHDRVRDELIQLWMHDPEAWSRRGDKIIYRSEDIHGTITKLRRDVPDYLYSSKGNVIVFDAAELERFLGISLTADRKGLKHWLFGR